MSRSGGNPINVFTFLIVKSLNCSPETRGDSKVTHSLLTTFGGSNVGIFMNSANMSDVAQTDQQQERLRIMLLGKCGAGKSSSGNTLLNKQVFTADMTLARVTPHCEKEEGLVEDIPIAVIDTPGFFETDSNKKEIVREILKCVKLLEPGPHIFVFVVKLGRMTQEDQATMKLIEAKFGPRVWDYTIVLFTHGDCLEGKTINDAITKSDDNLRNFIRKCSGGFHVFNNKNSEDQTQVTTFMEKIQTLIALNGGAHYQTTLYPKEEQKIRMKQDSILTEKNEEITRKEADLKEHYKGEELKREMRNLWRQQEESSRKAAEKQMMSRSYITKLLRVLLFLVLVGLLIGWALNAPALWLLPIAAIWIWMAVLAFPSNAGKKRQHFKKQ